MDINATASVLGDKSLQLLAVHAITGCDTVSYLFGKGKVSAVSTMMKNDTDLHVLGDPDASTQQVISAGHEFISMLYQSKHYPITMIRLRYEIFISRKDTPKIKCLPPTDIALVKHIERAHLQTMIWKSADQRDPPDVDIATFGWEIRNGIPTPVTGVDVVAPADLMKVIACTCGTADPCARSRCSCKTAGVSCTSFCKCMGIESCHNPHTKHGDGFEDIEEEGDKEVE